MGTDRAGDARRMADGRQAGLRTVQSGAMEIATQSFGRAGDPPVLMIMGAMASMLWWPAALLRGPSPGAGRFVIRYDNRDTGLFHLLSRRARRPTRSGDWPTTRSRCSTATGSARRIWWACRSAG